MKKFTILILLLCTMPFFGQWVQQNSGVTVGLNDVFCITEDIVVVVGNEGTILKTTNGGTTWVQKTSGTTYNLFKVEFPTANVGYAIGSQNSGGSLLLKTIDGGESWNTIDLSNVVYIKDISCVNENIIYMIADSFIKKSIDGGNTFTTQSIISSQSIFKIQFLNLLIGYSIGGQYDDQSQENKIYKTIDGGITWSIIIDNSAKAFYFIDENIGFISTSTSGLTRTIDGGNNFQLLSYHMDDKKVFSLNENVVWSIENRQLLCGCPNFCISKIDTTQTEANYEIINCGIGATTTNTDGILFESIDFANETKGYVVGNGGAIYKNSTGTMEILNVDKLNSLNIIKIYPNPTTDKITINFKEIVINPITIEIKDSLGKHIYKKSFFGENDLIVNTSTFSKGIYFVSILSNDKKQTQKLIIN